MLVKLFFCYAREDEKLLNKLKTHLRPLQRQGAIDLWHDREIHAGTNWEEEIMQHLNVADIVLLLVSPDFMESEYCYGKEMQRALERHAKGECVVIPVILRPIYWHGEPLGSLQVLPTDGKPITGPDWHTQDNAFYDVVTGIHQVIQEISDRIALKNLALTPPPESHLAEIPSVALSGDGKTLASGSSDETIKALDLLSDRELCTLEGHQSMVTSVALSGDGRTLVSGSRDGTIKVWDVPNGKELRTLTAHQSMVTEVTLSVDGRTVASVDNNDKTIRVWDLLSGKEQHTLVGHQDDVWCVALSADGKTLVSGSKDHSIKVWKV